MADGSITMRMGLGRVRLRLVLSALVCALLLVAVGVASYDRLFSRSATPDEVSPIARLVEQAPELDCTDVEAPDTFEDLSADPPTWLTAEGAARSLVRRPGERVEWNYAEPGLAVAVVEDSDGEVVRTASLLRLLPEQGWTLKDVTQCADPSAEPTPE
jgi:hypothetical protein